MNLNEKNFSRSVSLLWPPNRVRRSAHSDARLGQNSVRDLGLAKIITALSSDKRHHQEIERILLNLCDDPQVIRYRQDILEDILTHPNLAARFEALFPILEELAYSHYREDKNKPTLWEVIWRVNELARFVECVNELSEIFQDSGQELRSEGLQALRHEITTVESEQTFQHLVRELPELLAKFEAVKSVTIGVNLDPRFRPVEATLVSVNKKRFSSPSLLSQLLGKDGNEWEGLVPLHTVPQKLDGVSISPMMAPLFRDLAKVLEKVCQPIAKALKRYVTINSGLLANLGQELRFYLGAVKLTTRIRKSGLPMCKPELAPQAERMCDIKENYNLNLVLHVMAEKNHNNVKEVIVTNDVLFGPQGRIIILTGPNRGGKTTYIQAIGLSQILAQAGLYIPGQKACISPVDNIYTHFPEEEQFEKGTGRFGEEAKRFSEIFTYATRNSLLLLNESLSSTSHSECLYLAQDIVRVLRLLGVRVIFATHLHELAAGIDELNADPPGDSKIISMVASLIREESFSDDTPEPALERTYKVIPSPPMGRSYAQELARRYGVSFEQLRSLLGNRGVLEPEKLDK